MIICFNTYCSVKKRNPVIFLKIQPCNLHENNKNQLNKQNKQAVLGVGWGGLGVDGLLVKSLSEP